MTLRPRREHRSGESRLCGSGQNVLEEMTQLVSGDLKVRTQSPKLGQRVEDDTVVPPAGRSGVDRRLWNKALPRGFLSGRCV